MFGIKGKLAQKEKVSSFDFTFRLHFNLINLVTKLVIIVLTLFSGLKVVYRLNRFITPQGITDHTNDLVHRFIDHRCLVQSILRKYLEKRFVKDIFILKTYFYFKSSRWNTKMPPTVINAMIARSYMTKRSVCPITCPLSNCMVCELGSASFKNANNVRFIPPI